MANHKIGFIVAAVNVLLIAIAIMELYCFSKITIIVIITTAVVIATMFMELAISHIQD